MLDSCHGNLLHRKAVSDPYETGREKGREGLGKLGLLLRWRWACKSAVLPKIASRNVAKPGVQSFENGG